MAILLKFSEENMANAYSVKLQATEDDALMISTETVFYHDRDKCSRFREEYHDELQRSRLKLSASC